MNYLLIFGIPIISLVLLSSALFLLIVLIRNPSFDLVDSVLNFFQYKNFKQFKFSTKKMCKFKKVSPTDPSQALCDHLNNEDLIEELSNLSETEKISSLRRHLYHFIESRKYIANGDVQADSIDFNLDKHYRIKRIGNKWTTDYKTFN